MVMNHIKVSVCGCVLTDLLTLHLYDMLLTECGGSDVEMNSQLVDDEGAVEAKKICVEVEGACPATERGGDEVEEEEMSQDGGDTNQDVDTVVPGNDEAGGGGGRGEGKEEIANEEEEDMSQDGGETSSGDGRREHGGEGKVAQPADEGGEVMSQGEGDPCNNQTELTQHQDTEPAEAHEDNQVGDEGGPGEGKVEETTGAAGGLDEEVKPKAEGMTPQGSCSGSDTEDSDSEIPQFPKTLEGFGYHFKEGV